VEAHAGKRKVAAVPKQAVMAAPDPTAAHAAFIRGDYPQALSLYAKVLASPALPPAQRSALLTSRGYAHLRMNRNAEAAADFRNAIALDPKDEDASDALFVLQNKAASPATAPPPEASNGWGLLARLPGRYWIQSEKKATLHLRYEWAKIGVAMQFAGKDLRGNRIEGKYFIDPGRNMIRVMYTHKGKILSADLSINGDQVIETVPGKAGKRQVINTQTDGSFTIVTQKMNSKKWQDSSTVILSPASEQMIASLAWPDEPLPDKSSFFGGMLSAMKEGALAGFRDGMQDGVQSATSYRVRQATGTKECKTITGEIVKCP
jgi:tetratricopeptide (TPR) repeat protein